MTKQDRREAFIGAAVFMLVVALQVFAFAQAQKPITFAWNANPNPDNGQPVAGYRLVIDQEAIEAGNALTLAVPLAPGPHTATLVAYWADGTPSAPSTQLTFTVAPQTPSECAGHALTIAVQDWSKTIAIGARGRILFTLANAFPIVLVQVRSGTQVLGQFDGTDLRDAPGSAFSVPRTPGTYPISVLIKDNAGCSAETTLARSFTVS